MLVERDFQVFLVQAFTKGAPEPAMNWSLENGISIRQTKLEPFWEESSSSFQDNEKKSGLKQQWTTVQRGLFPAELQLTSFYTESRWYNP